MRNRKILLLLTATLIVLTACAPVSPQSDTGEADQPKPPATFEEDTSDDLTESGVEGQVFIGPVCAVVQSGKDCDDRPFQSRITVLNADVESVASLETDEEGRFQILLARYGRCLHEGREQPPVHAGMVQLHEAGQATDASFGVLGQGASEHQRHLVVLQGYGHLHQRRHVLRKVVGSVHDGQERRVELQPFCPATS